MVSHFCSTVIKDVSFQDVFMLRLRDQTIS